MKYVIIDGNNFSNISYHKGKNMFLKNLGKPKDYQLTQKEEKQLLGFILHIFIKKLHSLNKKFESFDYIFVWDGKDGNKWRKEQYPQYKSHRVKNTDGTYSLLFELMSAASQLLQYYPIHQIKVEKFEADDIIFGLTKKLVKHGHSVVIYSSDYDMVQIPQKVENVKVYHSIQDKYVTVPKTYNIVDYKCLMSDKSDDISGVKGFGKKKTIKAAEMLYSGKSLENTFYEFIPKKKIDDSKQIISENVEIYNTNKKIIDLDLNPNTKEIKFDLREIEISNLKIDFESIKKFYFAYGLKELIENFDDVIQIFSC